MPLRKAPLKFRYFEEDSKCEKLGNAILKPLPKPTSIRKVFLLLLMHICKKILFLNFETRIPVYFLLLFVGSLITDFLPFPKSYLSAKENVFNQYFVKYSWGWTFCIVTCFISLTGYVYCCGNKRKILKQLSRPVLGSLGWFLSIQSFHLIEKWFERCHGRGGELCSTKKCCEQLQLQWFGFDISGHAFILIFCNLFIQEEARAMKGWENLEHVFLNENYSRKNDIPNTTPLSMLSDSEFHYLQHLYVLITPFVRTVFIMLTVLSILWDVMLLATILYFHTLPQKLVGGLVAMLVWYCMYHILFKYIGIARSNSFSSLNKTGSTTMLGTM